MGNLLKAMRPSLHDAVLGNDIGKVMTILDKYPEMVTARAKDRKTPLHLAATMGNKDIVSILLTTGAEINAKDLSGLTPLHGASMRGNSEIVNLLIDSGANVNAVSMNGITPLKLAQKNRHAKIEMTLKRYGAKD
jgi:uncharacterized protein